MARDGQERREPRASAAFVFLSPFAASEAECFRHKRRTWQLDAFKTNGGSPPKVDLLVHGGGSVYLLRPASEAGTAWLDQHITPDASRFGGAIVVEHRYIRDIVAGAVSDGLRVR